MKVNMEAKTNSKYNRKFGNEQVMLVIAILIVFIIAVRYVGENYSLKVWGDEFGYWSSAAFLTGKDWSSTTSLIGYYGYGFGILLAPIMLLFGQNSILMVQAALVLEAFMLTSCVAAAYLCIGYFSDRIKGIMRVILAVLPILYPSNILNVNLTMAEILLVTLVWWYTYVALRFIKEKNLMSAVVLMLLSVYMYSVHQRTIAVMLISLALIGWVYHKKLFSSKLLVVISVLLVGLFLVLAIKRIYVKEFYSNANQELYAGNNLSGQTSKLVNIFTTYDGFIGFVQSLTGKYYYAAVCSYMLVSLGAISVVWKIVECIKTKSCLDQVLGDVVIGLNFFAAYLIGAIYMASGYGHRTDVLIYGRYIEHTIGPLIVLGVIYLYEYDHIKMILTTMGITALTTIIAEKTIGYRASNSNMWLSCSAMSDLLETNSYLNGEMLYKAFIRGAIFLVLLYVALYLCKQYKDIIFILVMLCICISWTKTGYTVRNEKVITWSDELYFNQETVLSHIDELQFGLYHSNTEGFFQFLRVNSNVQNFTTMEDITALDQPMYIITHAQADDAGQIRNAQEIIFENDMYILWKANIK